MEVIYNK